MIFVFGSNLAGRHGAGAAAEAHHLWGAQYGLGVGRTGDAYAIPTKGYNFEPLPLTSIADYVREFIEYARANPYLWFYITPIGTGLSGYTDEQIAPLFAGLPDNCLVPVRWVKILARLP